MRSASKLFNMLNTVLALILFSGNLLGQIDTTATTFSHESTGSPGVFLRMGVGTRALSMGSAFTAVANDASSAYWNPAGISQVTHAQFEFMNVALPFDRRLNYISGVLPIKNLFTLGISWVGLRISDIEGRSTNTSQPDYLFGNSQDALFFSIGTSLNRFIGIGGNFKLIRNNLNNDVATGMGFDAGVRVRLSDRLTFGAMAQDIGTDYRWKSGTTEGVPITLRVGAAFEVYGGVNIAVDMSRTNDQSPALHFGTEIRPVTMLPIRFGINDGQFTGGAGFALPLADHLLELNYGFASDRILNETIHRISVVLSFGNRSEPGYKRPGNIYDATRSNRKKRSANFLAKINHSKVVIMTQLLNVRSGPGGRYWKISQVRKGQQFTLLDKKDDWRKIRLSSGRAGWVHSRYIMQLEN